jgi:HK97 family phage major capsid protein
VPWTKEDPPDVAQNWSDEEKGKCVKAANAVLAEGGSEEDAIFACIHAAGKGKGGKSMDELGEPVISFGGAVKALGDGKVSGYLVRFTTAEDPDLTGEFFDKDTDFGDALESATYYLHGMDGVLGKTRLAQATLRRDEFGIWAEAQLKMRDEYERFVYGMAEAGKLGWSSGTAPHLVEYEPAGKARRIAIWPLGLDASLTPAPAEPRNRVIPLKTYLGELKEQMPQAPEGEPQGAGEARASDGGGADASRDTSVVTGVKTMGDQENTQVQPVAPPTIDYDAIAKQAAEAAIKAYQASLPERDESGFDVQVTGDAADRKLKGNPYKSTGEFLLEVKNAAMGMVADRLKPLQTEDGYSLTEAMGPEYVGSLYEAGQKSMKVLNEGVGSQGGFLVGTDRPGGLMARVYEVGDLLRMATMYPVSANSNSMTLLGEAETSRKDGFRRGGVLGYWESEGGTKTPSEPSFREISLKLKKVIGLVVATDELLQDAATLEAHINRVLPEELRFLVENAIIRGTGAGQPLGILASGALITVAAQPAQAITTLVSENIMDMWARMYVPSRRRAVWLINQDVEPQMDQFTIGVGTGGSVLYMPPGGLSAAPYGTLKGRPVIVNEYSSTLGAVGDIMLVDLSEYYMIEKGMQSASSIHVYFVYDKTAFRFVYRVDGQPAWNAPLTPYQGTNTVSPFVTLAGRP